MTKNYTKKMALLPILLVSLVLAPVVPSTADHESIVYEVEPNDSCTESVQNGNLIYADHTHAGSLEWYYTNAIDYVDTWHLGYHSADTRFTMHYATNTDHGNNIAVWYLFSDGCSPAPGVGCSASDVGLSHHMTCDFTAAGHYSLKLTKDQEGWMPYQVEFVRFEEIPPPETCPYVGIWGTLCELLGIHPPM